MANFLNKYLKWSKKNYLITRQWPKSSWDNIKKKRMFVVLQKVYDCVTLIYPYTI